MIDAQHAHVGAAAAATLGDLAEGLVVDAQEAHRAGRAAGRGVHDVALGPQPAEREAVAAARLLDQGRHAQGAENAVADLAHVILDGQHETGRQLPKRGAGAREGRAVGEETPLRQQVVEDPRRGRASPPCCSSTCATW